jgi:beta-alanine degradation protein BauB
MRDLSLAGALVLVATSVARAQDPATVDAKHYRVLIDNERTRVFHVQVAPGEKVPMHEHPDAIAIPLGPRAGGAYFIPAQKHAGDNPGKAPVDFIYVELKSHSAPIATVPVNRPGIKSTRLVENPKADAIRATADTGFSEPAGTTHDYDQVIVALGGGELSLTVDGKTTTTWKQGDVAFIGRNVRHESKNAGKPVDFVIVAIK